MEVLIACERCYPLATIAEWFDAEAAEGVTAEDVHVGHDGEWRLDDGHDELIVVDSDGLGGLLPEGASPAQARELATLLDDVIDVDAFAAYVDHVGAAPDWHVVQNFEDAFSGEWDSEEAFAQDFAESVGAINPDATWPANCIDWGQATRELFLDYFSVDAGGGGVYVFRYIPA